MNDMNHINKMNAAHRHNGLAIRTGLACAIASLFAASAHAADPVRIGYLIPLSGSAAASIGKDMSRATHLAIKHINEGGGIKSMGGAKLELVEVDTRGDAKVAITETERLITREKTPVLLGAFQSGVTFPATAVAEKYRTPWVVDLSAKADITERGFKYVFRPTQVPASANAGSMADFVGWANKNLGKQAKTAAIIYENTDWGQDMANTLRAKFKAAGIEVVLDEGYPPNSPDLRPLVLKVKGKKPDVVTVTSYATDAVQLHKLMAQMQVNPMAYIGSAAGQIDSNFIPLVTKQVATHVYTTNGWAGYESAITTPFAKRFWDEFLAANKVEPNELSVSAYAATWVIKDALERAGKADPESIRNALAKTKIENTDLTRLVGYDIVIDAKGQNPKKRYVMQQITPEGQYRTVWPENLASKSYKPVWPVVAR
ncbi:ABC transporter substrate-binding protein [Lacisediminimonas profundi]|uniref:ABC transporter substrate-binding protein n=1 Tax=Lacisediminimonas profundi TaxID=2603856 RepID=UPI00124B28EB|nr:ABC transporter substrate-binding protein [Lacisediminimonas profundi]